MSTPGVGTGRAGAARRARGAAASAFAAQGLAYALVLTSLPAFENRYSVGTGEITVVILLVCAMAALGTVVADRLARGRGGSRAALTAGLAGLVVALAWVSSSPTFGVAVAGFLVYGLGLGLVDAGGNMQAVAVQQEYGRSLLSSFHGAFSAAGIVGALLVAVTGGHWSERPVLWVLVLGVPVAVAAGVLVVRWGWRGRPGETTLETLPAGRRVPWRPVLLLGVCVVAYYIADSAVSSWSALFLDELRASAHVRPLGYAAYLGVALLARVLGDRAVQRWGRTAVVRTTGVLGAAAMLAVVAAGGPWTAVAAFGVTGLLAVVPPLAFSAAGAVAPGAADLVVARLNYFNYVGVVLGGVLVGAVGTVATLRAGFVVPAVLVLAVPLVAGVLRVPGPGSGGRQPVAAGSQRGEHDEAAA
ncbi:MAG: MFS transporter [Cellulomonas sp.]|nr:MFS transporter [Cellulomonas sp.]